MRSSKQIFITITWIIISAQLFAQEICNNCIDDDNDGLIDCYDPECANDTVCDDFYASISNDDTICRFYGEIENDFKMQAMWESPLTESGGMSQPFVGDIDNDGIPETIMYKKDTLFVLNGTDGSVKFFVVNTMYAGYDFHYIALADVEKDGNPDIIAVLVKYVGFNGSFKYICLNNDGSLKWIAPITPTTATTVANLLYPNLADFDQNDTAELYIDRYIFNAITGDTILSLPEYDSVKGYGVAADVLPDSYCPTCDGLELVDGNKVWAVDISNKTATLVSTAPWWMGAGWTSIADFDGDDSLDIILTTGWSNGSNSSSIKVYVWNPRTKLQIGTTYSLTNHGSGGRATVGNFDNDPELEIGIAGADAYICIDHNMVEKWRLPVFDVSSHSTGSTLFDFNCDGLVEIVYRDEQWLYIIQGSTGQVLDKTACFSRTLFEYPIVVDVDNDGHANIVCDCAFELIDMTSRVMAFDSDKGNWKTTRKLWNQFNYFGVNVNDDLTIPCVQQNHALINNLNSFLTQPALLDAYGLPICFLALGDAVVNIDTFYNLNLSCDSINMVFTICGKNNKGEVSPGFPYAVYQGNPLDGGTLLYSGVTQKLITKSSCERDTVRIPFDTAYIYVVVNDDGLYPLNAPHITKVECDTFNNVVFDRPPYLPDLSSYSDTVICASDTIALFAYEGYHPKWNPGKYLSDSTGFQVEAFPPDTIQYILSMLAPGGCERKDTFMLYTLPLPIISIQNEFNICSGDTLQIYPDTILEKYTYEWVPSTGIDYSENPEANLSRFVDSTTLYTYMLIATDSIGCSNKVSTLVTVEKPIVFAGLDDTVIKDSEIQLHGKVKYAHDYYWYPSSEISDSLSLSPYVRPNVSITFILTAISDFGCINSDSVYLFVIDKPILELPKAFTPNYDGLNDELFMLHLGIKKLNFLHIYDRWGNIIFHTNDLNDYWDGKFKSIPQENGTYTYQAEAISIDSQTILKKGSLFLIK